MGPDDVVFARFRLKELLGKGAYGSVYRAWDEGADREVALKIVSLEGRADSERTAARFEREGQLTAALTHPGIVRVHSQGREGLSAWLAYELVQGARHLGVVLRERDLRGRVELVAAAADALGYAHAHGVVHRDVKPENVLVDREGRVRVADFGLAAAQDLDRLTQTGAVLGTPLYMSPEQFGLGRLGEVAAPSDVWALGVILYEALTDRVPFEAPSLWELGAQVMNEPPPRPRAIRTDVPRDLEAVCLQALRRAPRDRYADAGELAADLQRWLRGESVSASRLGLWGRVPRRARWGALAAAPALLAVLAGLTHEPTPARPPELPPAVGARAPLRAAPAWRPKVGDVRWKTLGWEQQQEGGGVAREGIVELRLEERVEKVSGGRVTLKAKVEALRLGIGQAVRFDSRDPAGNLARVEGIVGTAFTYVVELASLRVLELSGATQMGARARVSLVALEGLVGEFLDELSDARIARHVGALYALTPLAGRERWEKQIEVCPGSGLVIRQRCAFERSKRSLHARLLEATVEGATESEVPSSSVELSVAGRLEGNRLESAWLTTSYTRWRKGMAARMRWRLFVRSEDGPLGETPPADASVSEFISSDSRAEAYLELGYRSFHQGDREKAFRCFQLSARGGFPLGMIALGTAYERGTGTRKDPHEALEWFQRAAEHGEPKGYSRMGRVYFNGGPGLPTNPKKAIECFQQAIHAGDARGWAYMGLVYRDGHGMPRDLEEARRCMERGAELDDPDAMTDLAEMLVKGQGGPVDLDEAERLLKASLTRRPDEGPGMRARAGLEAIAKLRAEGGR